LKHLLMQTNRKKLLIQKSIEEIVFLLFFQRYVMLDEARKITDTVMATVLPVLRIMVTDTDVGTMVTVTDMDVNVAGTVVHQENAIVTNCNNKIFVALQATKASFFDAIIKA